ncbi:viral A-type inclusion protein [Reticulomyxa filosa]|uniref:Viral A-type inclusion protein n=1 Tax=Reticulomyxa filosa TaxID=46433 RepID=X6MH75_RETFI|nr:viral A-type inclusion protein [Reticulomyxa filosa]|eukprot:ETO13011.1 viral A-type inclusion protein [Reticulomyxa filosa]
MSTGQNPYRLLKNDTPRYHIPSVLDRNSNDPNKEKGREEGIAPVAATTNVEIIPEEGETRTFKFNIEDDAIETPKGPEEANSEENRIKKDIEEMNTKLNQERGKNSELKQKMQILIDKIMSKLQLESKKTEKKIEYLKEKIKLEHEKSRLKKKQIQEIKSHLQNSPIKISSIPLPSPSLPSDIRTNDQFKDMTKPMLKQQVKVLKRQIKHLHLQKLHLVQQTSSEIQNLRFFFSAPLFFFFASLIFDIPFAESILLFFFVYENNFPFFLYCYYWGHPRYLHKILKISFEVLIIFHFPFHLFTMIDDKKSRIYAFLIDIFCFDKKFSLFVVSFDKNNKTVKEGRQKNMIRIQFIIFVVIAWFVNLTRTLADCEWTLVAQTALTEPVQMFVNEGLTFASDGTLFLSGQWLILSADSQKVPFVTTKINANPIPQCAINAPAVQSDHIGDLAYDSKTNSIFAPIENKYYINASIFQYSAGTFFFFFHRCHIHYNN